MKIAILISVLLIAISAVKIEKFVSSGAYFQHKGELQIQNETLIYVNTIDFSILQRSILKLGAMLVDELPSNNSQAIADLYTQISSNLSLIDTVSSSDAFSSNNYEFTFITNEKKIELPALKNKVDSISRKIGELKPNDKQILGRLKNIASSMEFLARSISSKEVTANILPSHYIKGINRRMLSVTHRRQGNIILISVKVPVFVGENFDLFKVINLPIIENKNIVSLKNEFKYIIVSKNSDRYFSVTENLDNLEKFNGILVYDDKNEHLTLRLGNSPCLYNMFMKTSLDSCRFATNFTNIEIFEKLEENKFLFAIRDDTAYTYTCGTINNNGRKDVLQGTGFLYLDSFCDLRTNDNHLNTQRIDAVLVTKDKYDFNLGRYLNKILKSHIKPIPEILPMEKISTNFEQLDKLFAQMNELLSKQDDLLKNLIELLPTDNPEEIFNSTEVNADSIIH